MLDHAQPGANASPHLSGTASIQEVSGQATIEPVAESSLVKARSLRSIIRELVQGPGLLVLVLLGTWYVQTMPPGISSMETGALADAAEFQVVGSYWGLEHSPGYPLYTVAANLFVRIVGLVAPLTEPAWRVSFFSVLLALATLILIVLILRQLAVHPMLAAGATLLVGSSPMFWRQAIIAEVYIFGLLLIMLAFWLAYRWQYAPRERPYLIGLGLTFGAMAAHHRAGVLTIPPLLLWMMLARWDGWRMWLRRLLWMGAAGAPMLLFYAYLPLAAAHHARTNMTRLYADARDPSVFWGMMTAREWLAVVHPPTSVAEAVEDVTTIFRQQSAELRAPLLIVLGILGLVGRDSRALPLLGVVAAFVYFGASYDVFDVDTMLLPLTVALVIGVALFFERLARFVARVSPHWRGSREWATTGAALLLFLLSAQGVRLTADQVDQSQDRASMEVIEMVRVIAEDRAPIGVLSLQHAPLAAVQYARARYGLENLEPIYPNKLNENPEFTVQEQLRARWDEGKTLYYTEDIFTEIPDLMPEIANGLQEGRYLSAPTYLENLKLLLPTDDLPTVTRVPQQRRQDSYPGGLVLAGYDQRWIERRAGVYLEVALYWQAESPLSDDFTVSLWPQGSVASALEAVSFKGFLLGTFPPSLLTPGETLRDTYQLRLSPLPIPNEPAELHINIQTAVEGRPETKTVVLPLQPLPEAWRMPSGGASP
jgi:hypothetical protein